jgi:hypothetical protein
MEQRALGHRWGLIEDAGAIALDQGRRRGLLEIAGTQEARVGARLEHMGDMSLAATGGTVDGEAKPGQSGPAVEPGDRGLCCRGRPGKSSPHRRRGGLARGELGHEGSPR